jgi:hypothetical protein
VKKLFVFAVLALTGLAVTAPVHAKSHPPQSHKCKPHAVSYRAAGKLVSGSLTANSDGTLSGTLIVHVTSTNHHAKADKGTDKSYTLDHVKAKLHGENPAALVASSRVKLKGTITTLSKKCDQTGFTATTTIKRIDIKPPKS